MYSLPVSYTINLVTNEQSDSYISKLTLALIPLIIAGIITAWSSIRAARLSSKNQQLENELNNLKRKAYSDFMTMFVDALQFNSTPKSKLENKLIEFKKQVLLYGSAQTIMKVNNWTLNSIENKTNLMFDNMEDILKSIREDIGLDNRGLREYELIQLFIKDKITKQSIANSSENKINE